MGRASRGKRERSDPAWTPFERGFFAQEAKTRGKIESTWLNSRYQVNVERVRSNTPTAPDMTVLSIKRIDKDWIHDWRDLQRIKNEVLGPEWEAVELYPAESRLTDAANQYWLWCLPPPHRWPFGFDERIVSEVSISGPAGVGTPSRQRPFDVKPADLETRESADKRIRDAGLHRSGYRVR